MTDPSPTHSSTTKPIRAKISALGTYVPPKLLTNADLEKMVDTTDDWIVPSGRSADTTHNP